MSNAKICHTNQWTRWYPEKIYLKKDQDNKVVLTNSERFIETNFLRDINKKSSDKHKKNSVLSKKDIDLITKQAYQDGFNTGFSEAEKENIVLKKQLDTFFSEFETGLACYESQLYRQIIKIILTISSYIIGKKINVNQDHLIKYVQGICSQESIFLKKPKLCIHPTNKVLIEKIFKDCLNTHQWKLIYDNNIDLNGCKIESESENIDATAHARWQELYRFIDSEEY